MQEASVVARIVGGLGNQLFIYATARRLAQDNAVPLVLDVDFFRSDWRYGRLYRLDRYPLATHTVKRSNTWIPPVLDQRIWRIKRRIEQIGLVPGRDAIIERTPNVFEPGVLAARTVRETVLDGYWQDERYFKSIEAVLQRELVPTEDPGERNQACAEEIRISDCIGMHCRRQHHLMSGGRIRNARGRRGLDARYYARALDALVSPGEAPRLFLFGDDPAWLLDQLPRSLRATVVDWNQGPGGEVNDLWLMQQCRRLVISNSTLSWWGGWLGADDRQIVTPRPQDLEYWVRSAAGWLEIDW